MKKPTTVLIPHADKFASAYALLGQGASMNRNSIGNENGSNDLVIERGVNTPLRNYEGDVVSYISEPLGTNLLADTNNFSGGIYTTSLDTIMTANVASAPNGKLDADAMTSQDDDFVRKQIEIPFTATSDLYQFSIYLKSNGCDTVFVGGYKDSGSNDTTAYAVFDLKNGTILADKNGSTALLGSSMEVIGNGWYRVCVPITNLSGATKAVVSFSDKDNLGDFESASTVGKTSHGRDQQLLMWGAQIEEGLVRTSYIYSPTANTTRDKTAINQGLSGTFCSETFTDGSFYLDIKPYYNKTINAAIGWSNTADGNQIAYRGRVGEEYNGTIMITNEGVDRFFTIPINNRERNRILVTVSRYFNTIYVNGVKVVEDDVTSIASDFKNGFDSFRNSAYYDSSHIFQGLIYDVRSYPDVLTLEEGIQLTSI